MIIVADIGGTYVRLAQLVDGKPQGTKKYQAADFNGLNEVLAHHCKDEKGEILIAAAGAGNHDTWTITNNPAWDIDLKSLRGQGWNASLILNDFEATAYSLPIVNVNTLKNESPTSTDLCVIGAGTGLGLAYYRGGLVQKTHGGHIPIASLSDEHGKVIKAIRSSLDCAIVFEDIVSGPGLQKLRDHYDEDTALKLFHEFLGIFASTALVIGNAYGGLYLTGGVIEALTNEGKFDFETFNAALCFDAVDCVKDDIAGTPIHIITDPYPALKGLIHAKSLSDN